MFPWTLHTQVIPYNLDTYTYSQLFFSLKPFFPKKLNNCQLSMKFTSSSPYSPIEKCFSFSGMLWLFSTFYVSIQIKNYFCSSSVKNDIDNFIGIALYPQIVLGNVVTLKILFLTIQEHGISFLLCYL